MTNKSNNIRMISVEIDKDNDTNESFYDWFINKINEMFIENIPLESIKELQPQFMYIFGAVSYILSLGCFIYFCYSGYSEARTKSYIALNNDDGECTTVPKAVSGQWLASYDGLYTGDVDFQYPLAVYMLEFEDFSKNSHEYKNIMDEYKAELKKIGELALTQNLADNILYWVSWQVLDREEGEVRRFQMNADPRSVFDNEYIFGQMATVNAECYVSTSTSTFDSANAVMTNRYSYNDFMATENCSVINPEMFGYSERFHGDDFTVSLDVNTAITAIAVNKGILNATHLEEIQSSRYLNFTQRIDNRFPNMTPLMCIDHANICLLKIGKLIVAPVYNHFGSLRINQPCVCSDHMDPYCNVFDFMIGFLYYPYDDADLSANAPDSDGFLHSVNLLIELLNIRPFVETNAMAFNASWASTASNPTDDIYKKEWRDAAYEFCLINGTYCNIAMFNSFDFNNHYVSSYYYNIIDGACRDSFNIAEDDWEQLRNNPPVGLVERYYECVATPLQAIFVSIGVAAGNTATLVPIAVICMLPPLYIYLSLSGNQPKKDEYDEKDLEAMLKALSLLLLRIRDGKLRGIKKDGVLVKIKNEILKTAKVGGGYEDSDDDTDDEGGETLQSESTDNEKPKPISLQRKILGSNSRDSSNQPASFWNSILVGNPLWSDETRNSSENNAVEMKSARMSDASGNDMIILNISKDVSRKSNSVGTMGVRTMLSFVQDLKTAMAKAVRVVGYDGGKMVYMHAFKLSTQLSNVDTAELDLFYLSDPQTARDMLRTLHSAMELHAGLDLDCDPKTLSPQQRDSCAYIIGTLVLTLSDVSRLLVEGNCTTPVRMGTCLSKM
mmetsp:Transcript_23089/g.33818  ORF Transcript_23089/g.33818 Transcript_23089/m.33818 type:complete len:840 (-) Transcript_23089:259-2778(-)